MGQNKSVLGLASICHNRGLSLEQISHLSTEAFTGHRIVKAFATETHEAEKFNRAGYHLFRTNMKVTAPA